MVLTEGWDMPEVGCCILARPTKKMGLYRQMIGRVLRPAEGKTDAIVLDHCGAVFRHGFVEDPVEWTLDPDRRAESPKHQRARREHGSRLLECTQCGAVRVAGEPCSHCGFMPQRTAARGVDSPTVTLPGRPITAVRPRKPTTPAERDRWHAMLAAIAMERGYKPGWAAHKYREKFGTFPAWGAAPAPIMPTPEVRSWVRSRQIAFAKRRVA